MGPKCHVVCLDAVSGELKWGIDLVREHGTTVPLWYAGQCPLIEDDAVILAPGGKDALLMAVALDSGAVRWRTPNPNGWKMTHSSVTPLDVGGQRQYVYCAHLGVVGVSAKDGARLWETTDWKISIATVPSPVAFGEGRVFLSGGYEAGSLMLEIGTDQGQWRAKTLFRLDPTIFGAEQHTPILHDGHLYGMRTDGRFVCLSLDGKVVWLSDPSHSFGRGGGAYILADGLIYALNDTGRLSLIEATSAKFTLLAEAQVLHGRESWGPMALAGTRLLARDLTTLVCLEVGP
jgi:outer membrane protein assembly factor BamB